MADNMTQFRWIVTIKEGLDALFDDRPDVLVAGDLLWYATDGDRADVMALDVMVAFGRPKGERGSYLQWKEEDVVPQVVFEVHSPRNTAAEMAEKRRRYDARGVEEYYHYNPATGALKAWLRGPDGFREIKRADGWTSPRLGVTFEAPRRKDGLVIHRPDGERFRTFQELKRDEDAARRIAEAETRRRRKAVRVARAERRLREEADLRADEADLRADEAGHRAVEADLRAEAERRLREAERQLREEAEARAARLEARLRELEGGSE
ncbi:MAG: hypothetical protein BGO49_07315 [Planctomycetales bacterium 71-10]|nr:MAG: hypothetical protein BGO49_07315 [Planctomycetales bacterium 71-10]